MAKDYSLSYINVKHNQSLIYYRCLIFKVYAANYETEIQILVSCHTVQACKWIFKIIIC